MNPPDRHPVHDLLEAIGAAALIVVGAWVLDRWVGWDPVRAAEEHLRRSDAPPPPSSGGEG